MKKILKMKNLNFCSFSQPQNEPSQFEEKDQYTLFGKYVASKMRKPSSLLDMDQMDSFEFEITSSIQHARKQRFVVQNFIDYSNKY